MTVMDCIKEKAKPAEIKIIKKAAFKRTPSKIKKYAQQAIPTNEMNVVNARLLRIFSNPETTKIDISEAAKIQNVILSISGFMRSNLSLRIWCIAAK